MVKHTKRIAKKTVKKSIKSKTDKLNDYEWGMGLEHEVHLYHRPLMSKKKIENFILFNSQDYAEKLINDIDNKNSKITSNDVDFLKKIPFEWSGRQCDGKVVIKRVPIQMPEFVTDNPFCSIKKNRNLILMTEEIMYDRKKYIELLRTIKSVRELEKKYGRLSEHPFGMTRYLKLPTKVIKNKYTFDKSLMSEYNGSYHVTFTLPYTSRTTNDEFIKMHQNFANQLQWLEPLMLSAYFTGDDLSPGDLNRVRGSFRVMIIGWGNLAGSDVRLFNKGIGRYAKTPTYWRKGLKFIDTDKLKACHKPSEAAKKEGAITSLSSDFRTFGSTDPQRPWHRESGTAMTKPNGVEFRIFDHFNDEYILHLVLFISLVAENSRLCKTEKYVYKNKIWINELHNIMKYGYSAKLSTDYIKLLRDNLKLKINIKSLNATDVFKEIIDELWNKNINGKWSKIFHANEKSYEYYEYLKEYVLDKFPDINKKGWQFSFMMKMNRNKKTLDNFNKLSKELSNKTIKIDDFKKLVIKIMGKNWINDIDNIADFYLRLKHVKINNKENGSINKLSFSKCNNYTDFNKYIIRYFSAKDVNMNI